MSNFVHRSRTIVLLLSQFWAAARAREVPVPWSGVIWTVVLCCEHLGVHRAADVRREIQLRFQDHGGERRLGGREIVALLRQRWKVCNMRKNQTLRSTNCTCDGYYRNKIMLRACCCRLPLGRQVDQTNTGTLVCRLGKPLLLLLP